MRPKYTCIYIYRERERAREVENEWEKREWEREIGKKIPQLGYRIKKNKKSN